MIGLFVLLSLVAAAQGPPPQARADAPADSTVYMVSYGEVMPNARATALAALKQFRDASRKADGSVRVELFEQAGRPGHFCFIEVWRDQAAYDARAAAVKKPLVDALQPLRVSDVDTRPYKTLAVGPAPAAPSSRVTFVISHVDVTPGQIVPMLLTRLAEESRKDTGNLRFDVVQHTMRANHFTVVETWQNDQALEAHIAAVHTKKYRDELAPALGSPLDERVYKAIE